jgi:hypothetical protein
VTPNPEDLKKLAGAFFQNLAYDPSCEYGSVGVDCKRPFGNSDVEGDVLEIIGATEEGDDGHDKCWSRNQREYASALYQEHLVPYLREQWRSFNGEASRE